MGAKKVIPKDWLDKKTNKEILIPERTKFDFEKLDVIKSEDLPDLMKQDEAAKMLMVAPETLALWRRKGVINGIKIGRSWCYTPNHIAEYLIKQSKKNG